MKIPVHIPYDLCGFDKLTRQEEKLIYNWYNNQREKLNSEPAVQKYLDMAQRRSDIRLDCIARYGQHSNAFKKEFESRCRQEFPEWEKYKKDYDSRYASIEQGLNRRILAVTWQRQTEFDVLWNPVLSPSEWLEKYDAAGTLIRNGMELPYAGTAESPKCGRFHADRLIVLNLQRILDWGFVTSESCSGMVADHPDRRHLKDSPDGGLTFKAGQPVHRTLYGSHAYVTFPKPESSLSRDLKNSADQIDMVRHIAVENGWVALDSLSLSQPVLRLELPMTYDGSGRAEIEREAELLGLQTVDGFALLDYFDKADAMLPLVRQVADTHGGIVPWTDALIAARWNALSEGIRQAMERQRMTGADIHRITDVARVARRDGSLALRCRIDGLQQTMKAVPLDMLTQASERSLSDKELASVLFKEELQAGPDLRVDSGLHR